MHACIMQFDAYCISACFSAMHMTVLAVTQLHIKMLAVYICMPIISLIFNMLSLWARGSVAHM